MTPKLLIFLVIAYVLVGLGLSFFRIMPAIGGWILMTMSEEEERIEKRRFAIILLLNFMLCVFNYELLQNFSWFFFILVSLVSITVIFLIFKLEFNQFHLAFASKSKSENKDKEEEKYNIEKLSDQASLYKKREKNINSVFSESLYNLLRKYNYILLDEGYTYEEVKSIIIKSEQKVFRFKNYHEAKYFYNRILKYSGSKVKDYCVVLGYKGRTLQEEPKKYKFTEGFKSFIEELKWR